MQFKHLMLIAGVLLSYGALAVTGARSEPAHDVQKSCIYNYITCKEGCEYYQDSSQIQACESRCDQSYHCRPKHPETIDENMNINEKNLMEDREDKIQISPPE